MVERRAIAAYPLDHRGEAAEDEAALERGALRARRDERLRQEQRAQHEPGARVEPDPARSRGRLRPSGAIFRAHRDTDTTLARPASSPRQETAAAR